MGKTITWTATESFTNNYGTDTQEKAGAQGYYGRYGRYYGTYAFSGSKIPEGAVITDITVSFTVSSGNPHNSRTVKWWKTSSFSHTSDSYNLGALSFKGANTRRASLDASKLSLAGRSDITIYTGNEETSNASGQSYSTSYMKITDVTMEIEYEEWTKIGDIKGIKITPIYATGNKAPTASDPSTYKIIENNGVMNDTNFCTDYVLVEAETVANGNNNEVGKYEFSIYRSGAWIAFDGADNKAAFRLGKGITAGNAFEPPYKFAARAVGTRGDKTKLAYLNYAYRGGNNDHAGTGYDPVTYEESRATSFNMNKSPSFTSCSLASPVSLGRKPSMRINASDELGTKDGKLHYTIEGACDKVGVLTKTGNSGTQYDSENIELPIFSNPTCKGSKETLTIKVADVNIPSDPIKGLNSKFGGGQASKEISFTVGHTLVIEGVIESKELKPDAELKLTYKMDGIEYKSNSWTWDSQATYSIELTKEGDSNWQTIISRERIEGNEAPSLFRVWQAAIEILGGKEGKVDLKFSLDAFCPAVNDGCIISGISVVLPTIEDDISFNYCNASGEVKNPDDLLYGTSENTLKIAWATSNFIENSYIQVAINTNLTNGYRVGFMPVDEPSDNVEYISCYECDIEAVNNNAIELSYFFPSDLSAASALKCLQIFLIVGQTVITSKNWSLSLNLVHPALEGPSLSASNLNKEYELIPENDAPLDLNFNFTISSSGKDGQSYFRGLSKVILKAPIEQTGIDSLITIEFNPIVITNPIMSTKADFTITISKDSNDGNYKITGAQLAINRNTYQASDFSKHTLKINTILSGYLQFFWKACLNKLDTFDNEERGSNTIEIDFETYTIPYFIGNSDIAISITNQE